MNPTMDYDLKEFMITLGITKIEEIHCANGTQYRMFIKRKIAKAVQEVFEKDDLETKRKSTEAWRRVLATDKE